MDDRMSTAEHTVMRNRARKLSVVPATDQGEDRFLQVLEFLLGSEKFAMENVHIREVTALPIVTPLPCVPSFIQGIMNIRGSIVSLLDLKAILGLPGTASEPGACVIILHSPEMEFGLLADQLVGLVSIPLSDIHPPPPAAMEERNRYLKGITLDGLVLLDSGKLLADKTLVVDETVRAPG